jgi:hypothetical protein
MDMKPLRLSALPAGVATTCAALCLAVAAFGAQAFELRGFRGVHWGEGADALRGEALVHEDGEARCYQREQENLLFGDTPLQGVRFCFDHDRLAMVVLEAPVPSAALSAEFERAYGRPTSQKNGVSAWGGPSTATTARVVGVGPQVSRITLSVSKLDAETARRLHKLATADAAGARRVAAVN